MHTFLTAPVLASVDEYIPFAGMLIPITLFFVGLIITIASLYFKNQNRRLWHETARIALEKGQPIPIAPSAMDEVVAKKPDLSSGRSDVKAGLILIAIAVGFYFGFNELRAEGHYVPSFLFYIPGFIGVALLLNALITFLTTPKNPDRSTSSMPPKA